MARCPLMASANLPCSLFSKNINPIRSNFFVEWATTTMKSLSPDFRNFPASSNGIFDGDRLYLDHKVRMRQSTDLDRCTGR